MGVTTMPNPIEPRWTSWIPLWLVLSIALAYSGSLTGVFVFDDFGALVDNPNIRTLSKTATGTSRPLTQFTFYLNYVLDRAVRGSHHPLSPVGFHLVNILIHMASTVLLYRVARYALTQVRGAKQSLSPAVAAAAIAALWGLHPFGTSAVTYLCQRSEALVAMFFLLTLYAVIQLAETGSRRWLAGGLIACAAGVASKEVMLTVPLLVLLFDRAFIGKTFRETLRRRWLFHAGCFATLGLQSLLIYAQSHAEQSYAWQGTPPLHYFYTQALVLVHYLRLVFVPTRLCLDYQWPVNRDLATALPAIAFLGALGLATFVAFLRRPAPGYPAFVFFAILAPTSSFLPLPDCAFDHRMYLPLAGIIPYGVLAAGQLRPRLALTILAATAIALGGLTFRRNMDYRSELAVWQSVVKMAPDNLRARNDLAVALAEAGRSDEAVAEYESVIQRIPSPRREELETGRKLVLTDIATSSYEYHYLRARLNLGITRRQQGHTEAAISNFVAALCVFPRYQPVADRLTAALTAQGCPPDAVVPTIKALMAEHRKPSPPRK